MHGSSLGRRDAIPYPLHPYIPSTCSYFGSILMDRGDRISWTGDAHLAQKAALAGFGGDVGTEMVYQNLLRTRGNDNGVISCDM